MNGRCAGSVGGPGQEVWAVRDIEGRVSMLGMVERAQLVWHGRGGVGRAAPMDPEMGQHVVVSSLPPRCVDWASSGAREGLAWVEARAAKA